MPGPEKYAEAAPARASVDQFEDACVLDFGANWCGHCQAAQPFIEAALAAHPGLRHLKIEDGKGRPLGRSFKVTLWPTLIFLRHGVEVARVVRPTEAQVVRDAVLLIDPPV
jgi:thioredoxin 1